MILLPFEEPVKRRTKATAVRVTPGVTGVDPVNWRELPGQLPPVSRSTGRRDLVARQGDRISPPQKLHQHANAPRIIEPDQFADPVAERTMQDPHRLAGTQQFLPPQAAAFICFALQGLDDPSRKRHRETLTRRDDPLHAMGSVHASPAIALQVQRNEDVAGKKRHLPPLDPACMAPCLQPQGKKGLELLVAQMKRRALLAFGLALDCEPLLTRKELLAIARDVVYPCMR